MYALIYYPIFVLLSFGAKQSFNIQVTKNKYSKYLAGDPFSAYISPTNHLLYNQQFFTSLRHHLVPSTHGLPGLVHGLDVFLSFHSQSDDA